MSDSRLWLTRISLCLAVALSSFAATSAYANSANTTTTKGAQQVSFRVTSPDTGRQTVATVSKQDLECLAEALYFEARGEGTQGQRAVAEVILNRVDHPRFPKTVCGVVNQRGQFSYKGRVSPRIHETGAYARVKNVAIAALAGAAPRTLTNGATYFHTGGVRPSWSRRFERTTRIGAHIFYRADRRLASN